MVALNVSGFTPVLDQWFNEWVSTSFRFSLLPDQPTYEVVGLQIQKASANIDAQSLQVDVSPPPTYDASQFVSAVVERYAGDETVKVSQVEIVGGNVRVHLDTPPANMDTHRVNVAFAQ